MQNNHPMQPYHDMLSKILETGKRRPNRTGTDTLFVPGETLKFDMADGFPAITTKRLAFKSALGELLGFFRGYTSAAQFREIGCKVWDGNANETKSWLANKNRQGVDSVGRIYGSQWTDWRDWREATSEVQRDDMLAQGYEVRAHDSEKGVWVMRRGINQLESVLKTLMTNPTDRRMLVTGWRPDEADLQCIPVCHVSYQLLADVDTKELHLCFFQRSFDSALAFNITLGALYLHIFAKLAGYRAGTITQFIGDAHVYINHIESVKLMLSREHYAQPTLVMGESIPTLTSVDQIPGVFTRIQPEDFRLEGYEHHPAIPMPMAA